jgi:hypothetical protein
MRCFNRSHQIVVYDARTAEPFVGGGARVLERLRPEDLDAWLQHNAESSRSPGLYPLVAGLAAIPPRTVWDIGDSHYLFAADLESDESSLPTRASPADLPMILGTALRRLGGRRIAVELSGGLDSSLVIEFLKANHICPAVIGFTSVEYEFRTERIVQAYYAERAGCVRLLSYEETAAFSALDEVPFHPFPTLSTHFFSRHRKMAECAAGLGVDVLLSGEAGDQLFGMPHNGCALGERPPQGFRYWNLAELWSDQYVYRPRGVQYLSALGIEEIATQLLALRGPRAGDPQKRWARRTFAGMLPELLVKYSYCAFHDGWVCKGLQANSGMIATIAQEARQFVPHPAIDPAYLESAANTYGEMPELDRRRFLLALAFVVWVVSLQR